MDSLRDRIGRLLEEETAGCNFAGMPMLEPHKRQLVDRILALFSDELDKVDDLNDLRGKIGDK